jgi:hypothetical protein
MGGNEETQVSVIIREYEQKHGNWYDENGTIQADALVEKIARYLCLSEGFDPDLVIKVYHPGSAGEHETRFMVGWKMYIAEATQLCKNKALPHSTETLKKYEPSQLSSSETGVKPSSSRSLLSRMERYLK